MPSLQSRLIRSVIIKGLMKNLFDPDKSTISKIRTKMAIKMPTPRGTIIQKTKVAGLPAEWVRDPRVPPDQPKVILHFHGGGYCGSCDSHRDLAARISQTSACRVLVVEYRLAPEHPYPAANEDCLAAYRWLLESGVSADHIVIGGDSFGAGLTIMTLLNLRNADAPLPAGAFLLSPWDFTRFDGESYISRAGLDPYLSRKSFEIPIRYYLDPSTALPPVLSPITEDLSGLPPLLIQVGDHEVVLSDSLRLAEYAKASGVDVTLEVWESMWHQFQMFAAVMPEARKSIEHIGRFVKGVFNFIV